MRTHTSLYGLLAVALVASATTGAVAQIVAEAPGPAVLRTMPDAPLTQSSEAICRAKLGGTSQTLIMVADPGDFSGTGMLLNASLKCAPRGLTQGKAQKACTLLWLQKTSVTHVQLILNIDYRAPMLYMSPSKSIKHVQVAQYVQQAINLHSSKERYTLPKHL